VSVEGVPVEAGNYALYTIPGERLWTVILSRNTDLWGAFGYHPKDDALRFEVEPEPAPFAESFIIVFEEVTVSAATLVLHWERLRVPIRMTTSIHERVMENIRSRLADREAGEPDWGFFWRAAKHLLERGEELAQAREWIERSIGLERNWMNLWTAAEVLRAVDERERAIVLGEEALEVCRREARYCPYGPAYRSALSDWRRLDR
jgi:hypothetical protein